MNNLKSILTFFILFISISLTSFAQQQQWLSASAGKSFTVATTEYGALYAWGKNNFGQLGNGTNENSHKPIMIGNDSVWAQVSCGLSHTLALRQDGTLWAWGLNNNGQLGDGTTTDRNTPVQIGTATYDNVICGWNQSFALASDGTLWAWGDNVKGQLGDGTTTDRNVPTKIGTNTWSKIASGNLHTLGIDRTGKLWAWGDNTEGQLGNGNNIGQNSPVLINSARSWDQVACGDNRSFCVDAFEILGAGAYKTISSNVFTTINYTTSGGGDINEIKCFNKTLFLTFSFDDERYVRALGDNTNGELGNGTYTNANSIINVVDPNMDPDVSLYIIECGYDHTVYLDDYERKICMTGNNDFGQLASPFLAKSNEPVCLTISNFIASDKISDSKVEISWNEELVLPYYGNNPAAYIQIREYATGKEVYSEIIDSIYNYSSISGKTLVHIKPDQERMYQLRVIEYGPGTVLIDQIGDLGTTLPFQKPDLSGSTISPWEIALNVNSNSDYDQKMYLYRDDSLITILDTSANNFVDLGTPDMDGSIVNGNSYTYKLLSIHLEDKDSILGNQLVTQSTYLVDFQAEDNSTNEKIKLSWNDLSAYVDNLIIKRDGVTLIELNGQETYYEDLTAIPGFDHLYTFELYKDEENKITFKDTGSLVPNGNISGFVFNTAPDDFTLPIIKIIAKAIVAGEEDSLITYSNANGYYEFEDVSYFKKSNFTITASLPGTNIKSSETVELDLENFIKLQNFTLDAPNTELESTNHVVSNFKSTTIDSLGIVQLEWDITATDTIHYLVYRADELIEIGYQTTSGTFEFDDLEGTPWVAYTYSIRTYDRTFNNLTQKFDFKFSDGLTDTARYPQPYAIKDFVATANTSNATVDLTWNHPQGNIDGFRVFRNDSLIDELPKSALSYIDLTGANTTTYTYSVHSYKTLANGTNYNSSKVFSSPVVYPALSIPGQPTASNTAQGFTKLDWNYSVNADYNFTGYHVLRTYNGTSTKLTSIRKSLANSFIDETGVPNRTYQYAIQAYKSNLESTSLPSAAIGHTYLALPKVMVSSADGSKEGMIDFETGINPNYNYLKIAIRNKAEDEQYTEYNANTAGKNIPWNKYSAGTQTFALTAVKMIDGVNYYGTDTTQADVTIAENGPYAIDPVSNLSATSNSASHVKLSWEYPNYFIPFFHIYRDGVWLDSIEGVQKVYYDNQVSDNQEHLYRVQVKLDVRKSKFSSVYGQKLGRTYIYGTVYKEEGKEGIANAKVSLSLPINSATPEWFAETTTNLSGYYEFRNIPTLGLTSGVSKIEVSAFEANASLENSSLDQVYMDNVFSYNFDFVDTLPNPKVKSDTITWVKDITASSNFNTQSVELRWQTTNANYTSFEVYRGLVLIATVPSSQSKLVIDNGGLPGYDYAYRIKPIWQKSRTEKIEGLFFVINKTFPAMLPVEDLNASIINDAIRINWNHPVDLGIEYEVLRNNTYYTTVNAGESLEVIDSTGTIGSVYKYTVTPLLVKDLDIKAEEQSVSAAFPAVKKVREITAVNVPNGVELTWRKPSDRTTHYKIYINDKITDTLETEQNGEIKYISYSGAPNTYNTYSIASGYKENGRFYFGKKSSVGISQNDLLDVQTINVTPFQNKDQIEIEITKANYPYSGISGIEIERGVANVSNAEPLGLVKFQPTSDYVYLDKTGFPETNYQYEIYAYSIRNGVKYRSSVNEVREVFPKLSAPYSVAAKEEKGLYRTILWKHNREDISLVIRKHPTGENSKIIGNVSGNKNRFKDTEGKEELELRYSVQAKLEFGGNEYLSNEVYTQSFTNPFYLFGWGGNSSGQIGNGATSTSQLLPSLGGGGLPWIKASGSHAISADSSMYAWGGNAFGHLGIGNASITSTVTPIKVPGNQKWVDISAENGHVAAIAADGTLWTWGYGRFGQTGRGHNNWYNYSPGRVGADTNWVSVKCGESHCIALKSDGTIHGWGSGGSGQLGNGNSNSTNIPVQIGTESNWTHIASGSQHCLGRKSNGNIYAWGQNNYGQLGDGTTTNRNSPKKIGNAADWASVTATRVRSFAVKNDGTYWAFGGNYSGLLFSSSVATNQTTPIQLNATYKNGVTAGGFNHGLFVKMDKTLWTVGYNNNGQLGNGSTGNRSTPDKILDTKPWLNCSAYGNTSFGMTTRSDPFANFAATDGTLGTKVKLTWDDASSFTNGKNILIYRDTQLISSEDMNVTSYSDLDAVPGKKHAYSLRIESTSGILTSPAIDLGWRTPNGVVKGNVVSLIGNQPVPDVILKLKVEAEEGNFYYETTSDTRGNFRFDDVYYGEAADVTVSASYLNHEFVKDTLLGQMDETVKSLGIGTFIDKTANLISGSISRLGGNCPMDSIPVVLVKHYNTKASIEETQYTISDGSYAYSVNPFEDDLKNFELQLPEQIIKGMDTIWYAWNRNNIEIDKSTVSTTTPKQNFIDTMGVTYKFNVQNTCTSFPGTEFTLNITSEDGCFERTIVSNDNGSFKEIQLPPLAYIVEVANAAPLTPNTLAVIDYLSVRPLSIDLTAYNTNSKGDSTYKNAHYIKESMVYHNIPKITLTKKGGIENIPCEPDIYLIRKENSTVLVNFEVLETHSGTQCHVGEGFLVVKNSGAEDGDTILQFNETTGRFGDYSFVPGPPATIAPYYKGLVVEYHTKTGYVSEAIYKLLIEGEAQQPGNDVIVTNEEGKGDEFQIPLGVLRDPPGDGSYSYIEKGVETSTTLSVSQEFGGSLTGSLETAFALAGAGLEVKASAGVGGGTNDTKTFTISNTTTQRFETSAASDMQTADGSEYFVGDNADIIIGAGIALKYGIIESIEFNEDSCKPIKSTRMGITTDKLKTTWVYTVADIEALIDEYKNALVLAEAGRLELTSDPSDENAKDTNYFRTLIANWESVLEYHKLNTLPHYNLCDKGTFNKKFPTISFFIDPIRSAEYSKIKEAAESFQDDCFCNLARDGKPNSSLDSLIWTDELINRYRVAKKQINTLYEYQKIYSSGTTPPLDYKKPDLSKYSEPRLNGLINDLTDADKAVAENITFSGNTSIEKSFTNSVSSSSAFSQSVFVNASLYVGLLVERTLEIGTFAGVGAGATFNSKELEIEKRIGGEITFDFNQTWETDQSTTTEETSGYVLSDDDAGDQFSVTVIKGLQNNHTPYFELFAGRSSCPYEPGTLARDRPRLTLEYPDGTIVNNAQYDVDTEEPAYFPLKISNLAPEIFDEARYYTLIQAPNSNQFGAQVTADGSGQYFPLVFSAKSGGSSYTGLYVNKAGNGYDYPDITMQLIPTCLDESADLTDGFNGTALNVEAYFRKPCSNISILDPTENWRINRAIDSTGTAYQKLIVRIGDYDPENEFLEKISFEYRRVGTNVWIEDKGLEVYKDSLQRYYDLYKSTYKDPVYPFIWDILNKPEIIDGEYELRAVVHCGIEGKVESNIVKGRVDRTTISLFGTPKPTDGVLNIGENVEVLFNEPIECGYETKANAHYAFYRKSDGLKLDFTPICNNNSIIYIFDGDLDSLDKEVIAMQVFEVQDLNGNVLRDTIHYEFVVNRSPVSWWPYTYAIDVYKGESKTFDLSLINTGAADATVNLTKTGTPNELLSIINSQYTLFRNSTSAAQFRVNAQTQGIGTYTFTVDADVTTDLKNYGIQTIPIQVNVLPVPPAWKTPTGLPLSTIVICNFELDDTASTDSMDKIAITINNEVRGVDNIYKSNAGANLYYAVVNVQGDASNVGDTFGYRIWDASKGAEYNGKMTNGVITFGGGIYGSTTQPRIIEVKSQWDSVRYIPLQKGWNWLAFNYKKQTMDVTNMLAGLNLSGGEVLKTQSKQSVYSATTQKWFSSATGLSSINTANGYLLLLNEDDLLRASGDQADIKPVAVKKGWNLIGNPYQSNKPVNDVFSNVPDSLEGAILKTGGAINKASVYDNGAWVGGITAFEVNQSYMFNSSKQQRLNLRRSTDCEQLEASNHQYNLSFLAGVNFEGSEWQEEGDYVVAKIDGVCRGKAYIQEVETPNRHFIIDMFVYGDSADLGKVITYELYRANKDQSYPIYVSKQDSFVFTADLHKGLPDLPIWLSDNQNFVSTKAVNNYMGELKSMVYPNPFSDQIKVKLEAREAGLATVKVYDAFGRIVYTTTHQCIAGMNAYAFKPSYLASGIYTVQITLNGRKTTVKMVKQ